MTPVPHTNPDSPEKGLRYGTLMTRLRDGWPADKAITTPLKSRTDRKRTRDAV